MPSQYKGSKGGCPIRRSLDQSSFAAPQGLSQRTTSFIASQRQGIHRMLLRHLITLMIGARTLGRGGDRSQERPALGLLQEHVFACRTHPDHRPASRRWFMKTRCFTHRACSLFTISNIRARPNRADANLSDTGHQKTGGARRDRTDDLLNANQALSQLSYGPVLGQTRSMVGLGRLERPTSPLSGVRSNHLSYRPRPRMSGEERETKTAASRIAGSD